MHQLLNTILNQQYRRLSNRFVDRVIKLTQLPVDLISQLELKTKTIQEIRKYKKKTKEFKFERVKS